MKSGLLLRLGALAGAAKLAAAECPNACSGRGTCGAYDMCSCYNGHMGNDCSERICPFGLAHVDSPKGDLDMDNDVEQSTVVKDSQMYKSGTSELFPIMMTVSGLETQGHDNYNPATESAVMLRFGLSSRLGVCTGMQLSPPGTLGHDLF